MKDRSKFVTKEYIRFPNGLQFTLKAVNKMAYPNGEIQKRLDEGSTYIPLISDANPHPFAHKLP